MSLTAYGYGCLRLWAVYAGTRSQGTLFYISVVLLLRGFMGHANNILEWKSQTWQKAGLRVSAGERREAREGKGLGGVKGKHPEMVNNQKVDF